MKKIILVALCFFTLHGNLTAQNNVELDTTWYTSLSIAKILARNSDKMVLMVWDGATKYPLPVVVKDENGKSVFIKNLFEAPILMAYLKDYFVPVRIGDEVYADLFYEIEGRRNQAYIDKFNDDTLKVMDANGNILGTSGANTEVVNLSKFIAKYSLDTSYLKQEILNYQNSKDFYSTFYLASKYIDYSLLVGDDVRSEVLKLSDIYFDEAKMLLNLETFSDKDALMQRLLLTQLKQDLIRNKPRKIFRQLKKIEEGQIEKVNLPLVSFLKYTAYRLQNNVEEFKVLESEISLLNLKQAQLIVNLNRK